MKKPFLIAAFFLFASVAHAQAVQPGHICDSTSVTNQCTTGYTCDSLTSICVLAGNPTVNPNPPPSGTTPNYSDGSTCTPACGSGQTCSGGLCIADLTQTVPQSATSNATPGFVPLAPIPGLTADQNGNSLLGIPDLATFLDNFYKYLIGIAAILAVIEIIVGGLQYATQDSVSKKGEGKDRIQHALLGLVLVLSPALVFSIINPSILNLSLSIPPLNTAPGTATTTGSGVNQYGTGTTTTGSTAGTSAGCNTPTGGNAYQSVSCATTGAASTWNSLFCGGGGNLQGAACKSGGTNADGSCSDGTLNWSVFCPGTSTQNWTFYMESVPSYYGTITSNVTLRPIPTDLNSVEGYVSSCSTGHVCVANSNNNGLIDALSSHPACPSGSTYDKFTPNGNSSQPVCASGLSLRCTDAALTGCAGGFIVDASP